MSGSESLSDSPPSDAALKEALQSVVQEIYVTRKVEDLTVKRVRIAVEKRLGLQKDFFKDHPVWKDMSKDIIQAEVVCVINSIGRYLYFNPSSRTPIPNHHPKHRRRRSQHRRYPQNYPPRLQDQKRRLTARSARQQEKQVERNAGRLGIRT